MCGSLVAPRTCFALAKRWRFSECDVLVNLNFLLSGAVSINPIIGTLALLLVLAWRVAGHYGVDRYLLPLLGTPWTGTLTRQKRAMAPAPAVS